MTEREGLAFYTCFYGSDSNWAFVVPPVPSDTHDCYYFTNNAKMYEFLGSTKWIRVKMDIPIYNNNISDAMSTKELRACPHRFPQLDKYKYVCWFDSKLMLDTAKTLARLAIMESTGKKIMLCKHSIQFETVWGEYELAITYPKYRAQKEAYKSYIQRKLASGHPEKLEAHYCGGFSIRDLSDSRVIKYNEEWYADILECGIEDQISLQFVHPSYKDILYPTEWMECWKFK